jgi:hypothetical protein
MCARLWPHEPRLRALRHEQNRGLVAARNTGVAAARGRFILPLDDDDKFAPEFLAKALAAQDIREGKVIVYCDFYPWMSGDRLGPLTQLPEYSYDGLFVRDHLPASSLYTRQAWVDAGGYATDQIHGLEDWDFWIRLGALGYCGVRIPEPLFYYRQHDDGRSMRDQMLGDGRRRAEAKALLVQRNLALFRGERPMGCCGAKNTSAPVVRLSQAELDLVLSAAGAGTSAPVDSPGQQVVQIRYTGNKSAPVDFLGYRVSKNHPYVNVLLEQADVLLASGQFQLVQRR